jgi:hypothetical protein
MSTRVFVIQEGSNDYSPAEKYGEIHFITKSDLRNIEGCQQNEVLFADLRKFWSEYIPGEDFIVPVGNPALIALVGMSLPPGVHKFLKWDGRRAEYIPFHLNANMHKPEEAKQS